MSTRMQRLLSCAVVVLTLVGGRSVAEACSCTAPAAPPCRLSQGDVIFVGLVEHVEETQRDDDTPVRRFTFQVTEAFAGAQRGTLLVESDTSSCGVDFALGVPYLVQAGQGLGGRISVHACSYTSPAVAAADEIAILRELQRGVSHPRVFGSVVEFLKPGPSSRSTDPDLWRPMWNVQVTGSGKSGTWHTKTDKDGRFSLAMPPGAYRITPILPSELSLAPWSPDFHRRVENPDLVELSTCSVMVVFLASNWDSGTATFGIKDEALDRRGCDMEVTMRSLSSDTPTEIRFVNNRPGLLHVYWLDFDGQRTLYANLTAGQSLAQRTYATHPWVVTDDRGVCLSAYLAARDPAVAIIR